MSNIKHRIVDKLGIQTLELRKYKDPVQPGDFLVSGTDTFLVLSEFRRGFFTIYTVTRFKPSRIKVLDAVRKEFIRGLYALGIHQPL